MPRTRRGRRPGALPLREDAGLLQPSGAVRRGAGPPRRVPGELPAGLHPPGAHQRRLRDRPRPLGHRSSRVGCILSWGRASRYNSTVHVLLPPDSATMPTSTAPEYRQLQTPTDGATITFQNGRLDVPARPIIPFIEGDGTGPDIWRASQRVFDAAVRKAYGGKREVVWFEGLAGEKANNRVGGGLPDG